MATLRIHLFGPPRIEREGEPVSTDRRKAVALLAYLLMEGGVHSREKLAVFFWPDFDQSSALAYLRRTLWEINQLVGPGLLAAERESVAVDSPAGLWLDVAEFRRLARPGNSLDEIAAGVALYTDDFMAGFSLRDSPDFDGWQRFLTADLRRELGVALAALAEGYQAAENLGAAIDCAQRRVALDFLHEPAYRQLMNLYMAAGRRADALRLYTDLVRLLEDELGVPPEAETKALQAQIAGGSWRDPQAQTPGHDPHQMDKTLPGPRSPIPGPTPPGLRSPVSNLRSPVTGLVSPKLPVPPTPFVGREPELQEIERMLGHDHTRLLTLLGPGGSGKTRLAIELAGRLAVDYSDGVFFVPLAPLSATESVLPAVAQALRLSFMDEQETRREQLLNFLRAKHMLIVLDNYEHLIAPESVGLPVDILAAAPGVKILVTSRTRLNVQGEQLYPVRGMRTPAGENGLLWLKPADEIQAYSALNLFQQRAGQIRPGFTLTRENLADVTRICHLVEGMPLAIELAVSWLELLSPGEIAAEIERSLDFLASDLQDLPPRQRSLRAVFESSWQLLDEAEREAFSRLTIFRGGFTREAAQAVAGASLRVLLGLTNKSWLRHGENGRYDLHELLRQYAEEKLQQDPAGYHQARQQHAGYYARWMQDWYDRMLDPHKDHSIFEISVELENIRAAWHWYLQEEQLEPIVKALLPGLYLFGLVLFQGDELQPLLEKTIRVLEARQENENDRVHLAILITAYAGIIQNNWIYRLINENVVRAWEFAGQWSTDALEKMGFWYVVLAELYGWNIDRAGGIREMRRLYDLLHADEDRWSLGWVCFNLAGMLANEHQRAEARPLYQEADQIYRQFNIPLLRATVLRSLADLERANGNFAEALDLLQTSLQLLSTTDVLPSVHEPDLQPLIEKTLLYPANLGNILWTMGEIRLQQGDVDQAFAIFQQQLEAYEHLGNPNLIGYATHWQSLISLRYRDLEYARQLRLKQLALVSELGFSNQLAWGHWELGEIYRVAGDLEQAGRYYTTALAEFEQQDDHMGEGFYHRGLADIAFARQQWDEAEQQYERYLQLAEQERFLWSAAYAHNGLGRVLTAKKDFEGARSEFAMALHLAHAEGTKDLCMLPLAGMAHLLAESGEWAEAAALAAYVAGHKLTWNETRAQAEMVLLQTGRNLDQTTFAAAQKQGETLTLEACLEKYGI